MFIRKQLSPYCIGVWRTVEYRGARYEAEIVEPAMHLPAPLPHGRNDHTGCWGPNEYGYTDFDDYHLAIYGA